MNLFVTPTRRFALAVLACLPLAAAADEAVIRKALAERLAGMAKVDEVRPSPMPGLWEVRIGNELRYTDASGSFWFEGELFDLRVRKNLTAERLDKINAVDFKALPLQDAIAWKNGNGSRRIAVFADPNCGACKQFERGLRGMKDITVYTFVVPILGGDSPEKSRAIWCAKDANATWVNWMLEGKALPKAEADCDAAALDRNLALSRLHRFPGTPAIVFEDGSRASGAWSAERLERRLQALAKADKT